VKRIYISGPMTGIPDLNFPAFNAGQKAGREAQLNRGVGGVGERLALE